MGPDGIPVEVWKSLGEEGVDMLLDLLQKIFEQEKMPEEWRDSVIVPIFKEKGASRIVGITDGIKNQDEDLGKSNRPKTEGRDNHHC